MKPLIKKLLAGQAKPLLHFLIGFFFVQAVWVGAVSVGLAQQNPQTEGKPSPRSVAAAVPRHWPPQYQVDENGKPTGFAIDVMEEVAARAGLAVTYLVKDNFSEAVDALRNGDADLIPNSGILPERMDEYAFTAPLETFVVSLFVRNDTHDLKGVDDLIGRRLAVVEKNVGLFLFGNRQDIDVQVYKDVRTALYELLAGHVDALVYPESVIWALTRHAGIEGRFKTVGGPLKEIKRGIRVRKGDIELLALLNGEVKGFVGTPAYEAIYTKWYGNQTPYWTVTRVMWVMGGFVVIVILVMAGWRYHAVVTLNRALKESEALFRAVVDNSPSFISLKDTDGRFQLVNRKHVEIFSPELPNVLGKFSHDFLPEKQATEATTQDRKALETKSANTEERQVTTKQGIRDFLIAKFPIFDETGAIKGIGTIGTDIAERKQVEEALRESEYRLRRSVLDAPNPIMIHAEGGEVLMVSKRWTELSGYTHSNIPTIFDWIDRAYGANREHMRELIGGLYEIEEPFEDEAFVTTASGKQRIWAFRTAPLGKLPDGRRFVISMAVDVTERKRAEEELRKAHDELEKRVGERTEELSEQLAERVRAEKALEESEQRFRDIAESASDWFWEMDRNLRYAYFSNRYAEIFGEITDLILGKTRRELYAARGVEIDDRIEAHLQDLEAHRSYRDMEYERAGPDGNIHIVRHSGKPIFDADGNFLGYRGTGRLVTEEVMANRLALESQKRLADAFESIADGVILYDADDRIVVCNSNYRKSLEGVADLLFPGTRFEDLIRAIAERGLVKGAKEDVEAYVRQRVRKHRELKGPFELEMADGQWFMLSEYKTQDGGIFIVRNDITDMKRAEETLKDNERKLKDIIDTVPAIVAIKDRESRYIMVNRFHAEYFGGSEEKVIGKTSADVLTSEHGAAMRELEKKVIETGEALPYFDREVANRHGLKRNMMVAKSPLRDFSGQVIGTVTAAIDITERKRAERVARESEERTRKILENLADGAITIDADGAIEYVNPETEHIFGYSEDELIGRNVSMLMPEPNRGSHHRYMSNYLKTGKAKIIGIGREVTGLRKDGTTFPMDITVSVTTVEGRTIFTGTVRDVTERKKAERALIQAKRKAETASRVKTDFLASMSHELRTPLNAIIGFSDTMREKVFGPMANDKYEDYVDNIHESGEHLLELINDILDVSMIEAGQLELNEEQIDVAKVIEAAVRLVNPHAQTEHVRLTLNVSEPLPGLLADERRIKQILLNLLSNAVKFTPKGGEVSLDASPDDDGRLAITISDTGIGMAEDEITKAMEPFGQIDSMISRKYEGTGLGLPLTKSLVEAHGGSIEIKSQPDKGTTVTVRFPEDRVIPAQAAEEGRLDGISTARKLH